METLTGLGMGLAAVGLVCFVEPWNGLGDIRPVLLGLGSGLSWGVGTVLSKRMFDRHAPDVMTFTAWQMLFGGLVMTQREARGSRDERFQGAAVDTPGLPGHNHR